ncbi:MAG: transposase, partial [Deinococcota bacterium]
RAFKNFVEKRARFPRFKSKHRDTPAFRIPQRVRADGNRLYVPKVGWVKFRKSQDIDGTTKSATFKREADGHWYVSLVSEFEMPDVPLPPVPESEVVGIDLGLKDFVTLSDGRRKPAERFFRKAERKLRRAAKTLSRRKRGSNRYTQARRKLARIHRRVANQRNDFVHQTTAKLVKEFSGFCIEDLSVKGMAKTKLSKSVLDAAFGEFRRQLEYKSIWHRKHLAVIDRFFPSSKLCGDCGAINTELTLGDREWTCACGAVHDRDLNAARNIKREGLSLIPTVAVGYPETKNARGDCVSPAKAGYGC